MSAEDWLFDFDPDDESPVECDHCGESPLWWEVVNGQFRLVTDEGELHECPARVARASEFPTC